MSKSFLILLFVFPILSNAEIKTHLDYLASDTLEGRKPGTIGDKLATKYLVDKLKDYKLSALGRSYQQKFTIFSKMSKNGLNTLSSKNNETISFEPLSISSNGVINQAKVVFAGFGISIPKSDTKLVYDDYEGLDVKDKIVIVMTGDPAIGNVDSIFRDPEYIYYQSKIFKINNAFQRGAKAILFVENPMSLSGDDELQFIGTDGGGNSTRILSGDIKNSFVNSILDKNLTLSFIQNKISKQQKPFSFELGSKLSMQVSLKKETDLVSNVVAYIEGEDPLLKKEVIVLGAHFDHLGLGGNSSLDPEYGKIHHGADDNASGTAFVLEMAKLLQENSQNLKHSYAFVFFNAEEMGLLGSKYFVQAWDRYKESYGEIKAMLNFDMIGRLNKKISVMGINSSLNWKDKINQLENDKFSFQQGTVMASDHASFLNEKIPSLFFTTGGHEDYHRSSDTSDKINYQGINLLKEFTLKLVSKLDSLVGLNFNLDFETGESSRNRGYGAYLGCIPSFNQDESIIGVQCSGISKDSPAQNAGIESNDILKNIGEVTIKNIYDLSFALKYYRANDEVLVKWQRGPKSFEKKITLKSRDKK